MPHFVGRADALGVLSAAIAEMSAHRLPRLLLVSGEAGMGKTALLTRFAEEAANLGARVLWGTCVHDDQAPGFWPWTQAMGVPLDFGIDPDDAGARLRIFDSVARLLGQAGSTEPIVVILDDIQWADRSTLDLLWYLARAPAQGRLLLIAACRPDELDEQPPAIAEPVVLSGLSEPEVAELIGDSGLAALVFRRSGGNPFFARELYQLLASGQSPEEVPVAVREAILRRLARVSPDCARMLEAAAVAGRQVLPDVLAEVTGEDPVRTADLVAEATSAGLLTRAVFTHDLYREAIYASLAPGRRIDLHERIGFALARRQERGATVFPAELARHFTAALPVAGPAPAIAWARRAAAEDTVRLAFAEAAGHLSRARSAISDAGAVLATSDLIDLLAAEAEARLRAGEAAVARRLLGEAWQRATEIGDPARLGTVALGLERLGARFAMPRHELVSALEQARAALDGAGSTIEVQVMAALARQLQHSVPKDRPRARPLAERAVSVARGLNDPATLASSLLAHHDALWIPGLVVERASIAAEITALAERIGDVERYAQGLLLTATAQLEAGSAAYRATLAEYQHVTKELRQPRHDYLLRTRQAALALLDGDIDEGERLSAEAVALGEAAGDTDTGNVRMSQLLEVTRARALPAQLREVAQKAVGWWVGAPAHAHAVAAGFLARAGDLDGARRELDVVLALPDWHTDRSYLWSVYIGELVAAAIALDDRPLCRRLLDEILPVADTCAVNGAFVCFMGAHAHRAGLLYAALREPDPARHWLTRALHTHRLLGARAWEAETQAALAKLGTGTELRRAGDMWEATFRGHTVFLRDIKGLHDLAVLLAHPGEDVPVLRLAMGARTLQDSKPEPVLDQAALAAYRQRLSELDDGPERDFLLAELRRATRPGGATRPLGVTVTERARKAVTARIRDAIKRIGQVHPEFGVHLDQTIRTGLICRYEPNQ